ncbi:MAG: HDIG domain-containing protein [Aureliella sp.]
MAIFAGSLVIITLQGWRPAFPFREGQVPQRNVVARVEFEMIDAGQTAQIRKQRRRSVLCYYENRPLAITQLGGTLKNKLSVLLDESPIEELTPEQRSVLAELVPSDDDEMGVTESEALEAVRTLFNERGKLEGGKFDEAVKNVLDPIAEKGVIISLEHDSEEGSQRQIRIFESGESDDATVVGIADVRHSDLVDRLSGAVTKEFQKGFESPSSVVVAKIVSSYLANNLPVTLSYQKDLSEEARRQAEESVEDERATYVPTVSKLAEAGVPLTRAKELPKLRAEYDEWVSRLSWGETSLRLAAFTGMIAAMYLLCGMYIYYQYDRSLLSNTSQLMRLFGLIVLTCLFCSYSAPDPIRAEIVPLVICAITMTITFGRQVALLVTTCLCLTVTLGLGLDISEFVTICSGTCAATLLLGRIRTRTKLIYVGVAAGVIVALTHVGVETVLGRIHLVSPPITPADDAPSWTSLVPGLTQEALRTGGLCLLATALMTGLLPFVERIFGVQTDLSLLELGDASHPLLRQLAQRAPGTYNHSINVAAIAEAAADSIGAHGLLVRVGAYFHDIGKMFKPNYFIENQEQGSNSHDSLQPAMSTLVIIAHVKDGADLGRKHRLPGPIIDFIEQHHGTTLVEYFYREAAKRSQEDPNREEVSETSFRYPGPKPQTLEAAVLMLADSVESASRTLVEPTSSRIQSLVDQIAMKKLLDGQFDQCGLTLQQLDQLKSSLVKSLTAIYHGRVKYTGQASA